jgi:hypothetical protein
MWKFIPKSWLLPVAKYVLGLLYARLHEAVDKISDADIEKAVDVVNKKIGGNKKFEYETIHLAVDATQKLLDIIKL